MLPLTDVLGVYHAFVGRSVLRDEHKGRLRTVVFVMLLGRFNLSHGIVSQEPHAMYLLVSGPAKKETPLKIGVSKSKTTNAVFKE